MNDSQWQQAQLPVSVGGLGLRASVDHAPAAYFSSIISSQDLKESILDMPGEDCPPAISLPLLDILARKMGDEAASVQSLQGISQKNISLATDLTNLQLLKDHYTGLESVSDTARVASLGLPHAGDWLNVIPSPALCLHLRPPEFITGVKYRLGMNIFPRDGPCTACSQAH